ncbi:hypothetical protein BSG1_19435 [Bacillus sp. SG-1]|nr:hypothetical protein BSG1_19435 [Bacillus sp. SG-1]
MFAGEGVLPFFMKMSGIKERRSLFFKRERRAEAERCLKACSHGRENKGIQSHKGRAFFHRQISREITLFIRLV